MFPQTPSHSLAYSHGLAEINWGRANKMRRGRRRERRTDRAVRREGKMEKQSEGKGERREKFICD